MHVANMTSPLTLPPVTPESSLVGATMKNQIFGLEKSDEAQPNGSEPSCKLNQRLITDEEDKNQNEETQNFISVNTHSGSSKFTDDDDNTSLLQSKISSNHCQHFRDTLIINQSDDSAQAPTVIANTITKITDNTQEEGENKRKHAFTGLWILISNKYGNKNLENKGSVARDHLALERTFLAWLRTSLAFASIGIATTQLFRLQSKTTIKSPKIKLDLNSQTDHDHLSQLGKTIGITFLSISIVTLYLGFRRYFEAQYWIIQGKFPASRGSVFLMVFVTFMTMTTCLVIVVVLEPIKVKL